MSTKLLDLDAISQEAEDVVIKLGGALHKLKPLSVLDFIENTKLMQELRAGATDMEKEFEATLQVVGRSFPTIAVDDMRKLTFAQLNKLVAFSRQANGEPSAPAPVAVAPAADAPVAPVAVAPAPSANAAGVDAVAAALALAVSPAPPAEVASIGSENPSTAAQ